MSKYVDTSAVIQVIGSVYKNPDILDDSRYHFIEEDFPEKFHRVLFGVIYNLHLAGVKKININTIEDYLNQRPKQYAIFKTNKGREYLQEILEKNLIEAFDFYYNRLKKMSLLRTYNNLGLNLDWLYDIDNIFDSKKKQEQEDYIDKHSVIELDDIINTYILTNKEKCLNGELRQGAQAGEGIEDLLESLKKEPAVGYPLYGPLINTITRGARLKKFYIRSAATGLGKAIPNYTLIPTPQGLKRVDEIVVGDYIFGSDGKPTKVLRVHPQPEEKEIFEVHLDDGRIAECCEEHLWEYAYEAHEGYGRRVENTKTILERTKKLKNGFKKADGKGWRFRIPLLSAPLDYPEKQYSIPPYVMGAVLGDGSLRYSSSQKRLSFSSENDAIPKMICKELDNKYIPHKSSKFNYNWTFKPVNNLKHNLWVEELFKDYPELWNKKSEEKFIPKEYLYGNIAQRRALLQGLMDTDGSISTQKGRVLFTTVSPFLKDQVQILCRELGYQTSVNIDTREKYTTGKCYIINISCKPQEKLNIFRLQKKVKVVNQYLQNGKRKEKKEFVGITNIVPTGRHTSMTCFTVEAEDHLFLMNDCIVTHNTRTLVADACNFACNEIYKDNKWIPNGTKEPTLFISTEQELNEIQTMMLAFLSNVNEDHILLNKYQNGEESRVKKAAQILAGSPLHIVTLPNFTLKDIENTIKIAIKEWGVKYIAYDYIHSSISILSDISSQAGIKGLREDNVLFMLSTRLKDICNEYGVFIISATQLNGQYQEANIYDQNLLRGSKAVADKLDMGAIMLDVSEEDRKGLEALLDKYHFQEPQMKMAIYKNRGNKYTNILLWCKANKGTCRIEPIFATDYSYRYLPIEDTEIGVIERGH